jgi:hypothetical protein
MALAVQPTGALRSAVTNAVVAGTLGALLAWGATVRGRLALAEADVSRLSAAEDPVAVGLLERFGALEGGQPPLSAAALYREWRRSPLADQDYPAVLAAWDAGGRLTARLELSDLDLPTAVLQALARLAGDGGAPIVERFSRPAGTHYVLAAPFPDGSVMTVGVGPRSLVFPPVRVARFLRGERVLLPRMRSPCRSRSRALPNRRAGGGRDGYCERSATLARRPSPGTSISEWTWENPPGWWCAACWPFWWTRWWWCCSGWEARCWPARCRFRPACWLACARDPIGRALPSR